MTTALDKGASVDDAFRDRLLDGLAASIGERGYRDTTVADIVRHARTSKRTFYEQFASKEDCLIELLRRNNDDLIATIQAAVDPEAEWQAPDPSGGRRLRRPHRVAARDHAELDPRGTRAWGGGPAVASARHGAAHRHAGRSHATVPASGARSWRRSPGRWR